MSAEKVDEKKMNAAEFMQQYAASFLGAYMAAHYDDDCQNCHREKRHHNQPVEDAMYLAELAVDKMVEVGVEFDFGTEKPSTATISDTERMNYLEGHSVAVESHEEWGVAYCVSRNDGLWSKKPTLREAVDDAIAVNSAR